MTTPGAVRSNKRLDNFRLVSNFIYQESVYDKIDREFDSSRNSKWYIKCDIPNFENIIVKLIIKKENADVLTSALISNFFSSFSHDEFLKHLAEIGYFDKHHRNQRVQQEFDLEFESYDFDSDEETCPFDDYEEFDEDDILFDGIQTYDESLLEVSEPFNPEVDFESFVGSYIEQNPPEIIIYAPPHSGKTTTMNAKAPSFMKYDPPHCELSDLNVAKSEEVSFEEVTPLLEFEDASNEFKTPHEQFELSTSQSPVIIGDTDDIKLWTCPPSIVYTNISSILKYATKRAYSFIPSKKEFKIRCIKRGLVPKDSWWNDAYNNSINTSITIFTNEYLSSTRRYLFHRPRNKL